MRIKLTALAPALLFALPVLGGAGDFAVILGGESGTETHAGWYWNSTSSMHETLKNEFGFVDENIYFLFEDPSRDGIIDGPSSLENVRELMGFLQEVLDRESELFMYIVGHGYNKKSATYYDLPGPDLSDRELGKLLDGLSFGKASIVMNPCFSGGFIPEISGPNRLVMTSTRKKEANAAGFAEYFTASLTEGDENNDGKVTAAESYAFVLGKVRKWYVRKGETEPAEHPLIKAGGKGKGVFSPSGGDEDYENARDWILPVSNIPLKIDRREKRSLAMKNMGLRLKPAFGKYSGEKSD